MSSSRLLSLLALVFILASVPTARASHASGVDEHTVALWLFDEPTYPNVILTDAGTFGYDLRLQSAYGAWWLETMGEGEPPAEPLHVDGRFGLVPGKFGRALHLPDPSIGRVIWPDNRQRYSSASMLGRDSVAPERFNVGYLDWTIECWFRATGPQDSAASLFELRNETDYPRGLPAENTLHLAPGRGEFLLRSRTTTTPPGRPVGDPSATYDIALTIPSDAERLGDGVWHHLAFTYSADERQMRHYIDGQLQSLPERGGFLPMLGVPVGFGFAAGLNGLLDEYRISDVVRYRGEFPPPESFSRNFGSDPRPENLAPGPPLLVELQRTTGPVDLGSRKHVLIDEALVDTKTNLVFRPQPPQSRQVTDFRNTKPWEPTPRFGSTIPDISTIWDEGDELRMIYTNGGMWGGKAHVTCIATSRDGLTWHKPVVGLHAWNGTRETNIVIAGAGQGALIKDTNPLAPDSERYKMLTWTPYRGYYLHTSPDAVHFRRNETVGLPFDTDGSTTFFWDDQRGIYHAYFRCVSQDRSIHRRAGHAEIADLFKPWPFDPVDRPWIDDLVLARPALGELPIIETDGQVYRFKAHKYEWAPDVYLAFPWRYIGDANIRPGSFLMVSRNGTEWTRYEDPYYFPGGWQFNDREVQEALMEHGMIRRGSEIWQFGTVRFTEHGGAIYGGVEHEGGTHDRLLRLVQRLDGFVAAMPEDAAEGAGSLVTKPFTFAGNRLELNLDASGGSARVELQDVQGRPLRGFALEASEPLRENGTSLVAHWRGNPDLGFLAGQAVRLKVELNDVRLFAFQFR